MTHQEMRLLADEVYACFNTRPALQRPVEMWAEMCAEVPVRALSYIREKLLENETLPRNFGYACKQFYQMWAYQQGMGKDKPETPKCAECDLAGGWFYGWKIVNGKMQSAMFKCQCNQQKEFRDLPYWTRTRAERAGWIIAPKRYGGNYSRVEGELLGFRFNEASMQKSLESVLGVNAHVPF